MPLYALVYDTVPDYVARRQQFRVEHLALAERAHREGRLLLAGALYSARRGAAPVPRRWPRRRRGIRAGRPVREEWLPRHLVARAGVEGGRGRTRVIGPKTPRPRSRRARTPRRGPHPQDAPPDGAGPRYAPRVTPSVRALSLLALATALGAGCRSRARTPARRTASSCATSRSAAIPRPLRELVARVRAREPRASAVEVQALPNASDLAHQLLVTALGAGGERRRRVRARRHLGGRVRARRVDRRSLGGVPARARCAREFLAGRRRGGDRSAGATFARALVRRRRGSSTAARDLVPRAAAHVRGAARRIGARGDGAAPGARTATSGRAASTRGSCCNVFEAIWGHGGESLRGEPARCSTRPQARGALGLPAGARRAGRLAALGRARRGGGRRAAPSRSGRRGLHAQLALCVGRCCRSPARRCAGKVGRRRAPDADGAPGRGALGGWQLAVNAHAPPARRDAAAARSSRTSPRRRRTSTLALAYGRNPAAPARRTTTRALARGARRSSPGCCRSSSARAPRPVTPYYHARSPTRSRASSPRPSPGVRTPAEALGRAQAQVDHRSRGAAVSGARRARRARRLLLVAPAGGCCSSLVALCPLVAAAWLSLRRVILVLRRATASSGLANYAVPAARRALLERARQHRLLHGRLGRGSSSSLGLAARARCSHRARRAAALLRAAVLVPWAIPDRGRGEAVGAGCFNPDYGLIARLAPGLDVDWLGTPGLRAARGDPGRRLEDDAVRRAAPPRRARRPSPRTSTARRASTAPRRCADVPRRSRCRCSRPAIAVAAPVPQRSTRSASSTSIYVLTGGGPGQHHRDAVDLRLQDADARGRASGYGSTLAVATFLCVVVLGLVVAPRCSASGGSRGEARREPSRCAGRRPSPYLAFCLGPLLWQLVHVSQARRTS